MIEQNFIINESVAELAFHSLPSEKQILSISKKLGFQNRGSWIRYASANCQIQFLGLED